MIAAYQQIILEALASADFVRATFAGAHRLAKDSKLQRVTIRPVDIKDERQLSISSFDAKRDVTRNYPLPEAPAAIQEILAIGFANTHITLSGEEIDIRLTKKGEALIGRTPRVVETFAAPAPHNRAKDLPLAEGRTDRILEIMGIMSAAGVVKPTMRAKFTQINEFLKLLDHVLPEVAGGTRSASTKPLEILDCGCGASYLTIAAHHWLNDIKQIPARVLGVDFNDELIRKSAQRTAELHCTGLEFATARIGKLDGLRPDIVLALHACDTATDDALAQAIRCNAKLILAVPCCHKNLNPTLRADVLQPLHRHGILHHRLADLTTDALRAAILRIMGYRTQVIEFVAPEHTARNLMIRAVRGVAVGESQFLEEYRALKEFFAVTPYLETALRDRWPVAQ